MSMIGWALFVAGAVFLALLVNGFLVEWIAGKFVSDVAARFGGFCFVFGLLLARSDKLFDKTEVAIAVGMAVGSVAALFALGRRALRHEVAHEVAH